ncbi:MAG: hypothetical protein HKN32_03885 [Flavobacteriales bacterium]|nr:hypothetical protein [Flavobacteriales bacterium]
MSDIRSSGSFSKPDGFPEKLNIISFNADFESGSFKTSGVIEEFNHPWIDLNLSGSLDLNDFRKFLELDAVEELRGQFSVNVDFAGKFNEPSNITPEDLNKAKVSGIVQFSDARFQLLNAPHAFDELKGKFSLDNKNASIHHFTGSVEDSQFSLKGSFENFLPFLLVKESRLKIKATFASTGLNFNSLLSDQSSSAEKDYHLAFPPDIDFDLDLSIDDVRFREFTATNVRGKATMKHQVLHLSPISLNTSQGQFVAHASTDGRTPGKFTLDCDAQLADIDVNQLFKEFENFGQTFIQDHHLKGRATAVVDFEAEFDAALQFDPNKINSVVDVRLRDGELIDLKSMRNISSYVSENGFVAPFVDEQALDSKLSHIYFATLENEILINNGKITVPKMEINSSAMDISAKGTHTFTNHIDYSIGFKIRDILSKSGESEFGVIEDDGLSNSFFLSMEGHVDDPVFGYDRIAHKEKRKEDRQKEKDNVKSILKEELGLFKNDPSVGSSETTDPKPSAETATITVSLGDDPEEDKTPAPKPKKKRKGWLKADEDEKEKVTINIDDEDEDY